MLFHSKSIKKLNKCFSNYRKSGRGFFPTFFQIFLLQGQKFFTNLLKRVYSLFSLYENLYLRQKSNAQRLSYHQRQLKVKSQAAGQQIFYFRVRLAMSAYDILCSFYILERSLTKKKRFIVNLKYYAVNRNDLLFTRITLHSNANTFLVQYLPLVSC